MKLLFRQRFFSWFDSFDIYDESGETIFTVEGQLAWGHCLHILNRNGDHIGTVRQEILTFLPRFGLYLDGCQIGELRRHLTFFHPYYTIDSLGWTVDGDWTQWDYRITDESGNTIGSISKELFHLTDTYTIDVEDPVNAIKALMIVLAIDAEKCSNS